MRDSGTTRFAVLAITLGVTIACAARQTQKPAPPPPPPGLEILWQVPVSFPGVANLVVGDSFVFLMSSESGLSAYSPVDGRSAWTSTLSSTVKPDTAGAHVAAISKGLLHVLQQETGAVAWTAAVAETASTVFSFGDQFGVIEGAEARAWTVGGTPGWRARLPGVPTTRVVSLNGTLFVGVFEPPDRPSLVAVDSVTGALRWQVPLRAQALSLTATDDRLYLAGSDGALYAYRTIGQPGSAWRRAIVGAIGDPVADDRQVYFALLDNSVRGFERHGGSQRWDSPQTARPAAGPMRVGSNVAVALSTGAVVELAAKDGRAIAPKTPVKLPLRPRLQSAVTLADGTRVFTLTIADNASQTLTAWGHPPPLPR